MGAELPPRDDWQMAFVALVLTGTGPRHYLFLELERDKEYHAIISGVTLYRAAYRFCMTCVPMGMRCVHRKKKL